MREPDEVGVARQSPVADQHGGVGDAVDLLLGLDREASEVEDGGINVDAADDGVAGGGGRDRPGQRTTSGTRTPPS